MIPFNASPGSFDTLRNVVPNPGKLTLIPIKETEGVFNPPIGPPFIAMFNPENFQVGETFKYTEEKNQETKTLKKFYAYEPDSWTFDLLIDGTGASGILNEVTTTVELFKITIGFNGQLHEPNKLQAIWGTFIKKCIAEKYSVKYTLFDLAGRPIRAIISVTLNEFKTKTEWSVETNLSSPDLTHARLLKAGERLDHHCHDIYRDTRFVPEVARANDLTSFRNLKPGTTLQFPPIDR